MKQLVLWLLWFYQSIISPLLRQVVGVKSVCLYQVSCSDYAKTKIQEYGIIKGGKMSLKRLLSCHPWSKSYGKYNW